MNQLLLADDDPVLSSMLKEYLNGEGFHVDTALDGKSALLKALQHDFDLIALDLMMPGMNGFDVLSNLRAHKSTPVLILTAHGEDRDSILGLELGADDFLAKPCDPRVLTAHIRAVLRRSTGQQKNQPKENDLCITLGDLTINYAARSIQLNGKPVIVTKSEYNLLTMLTRNTGQVLMRNQLSEQALGRTLGDFDRSLDMHISNLRRKLGQLPDGRDRIVAIRGVGYRYMTS